MTLPDHIYVFEFNCNQSVEVALRQIRAQGYAEPYHGLGKPITRVGVNFSTELRNVAEWAAESATIPSPTVRTVRGRGP
jgi:hypothetical protein